MGTYEIIKKLENVISASASYYTSKGNNDLIRISNHLPVEGNLISNNENIDKFLFVLSECENSEHEIEEHFDKMRFLDDKEYTVVIVDCEIGFQIMEMEISRL